MSEQASPQKHVSSSSPLEPVADEGPSSGLSDDPTTNSSPTEGVVRQSSRQLAKLEEAYAHKVLYIIGKEEMKIKTDASYARRALLHTFLWIRDNTRNKMANLRVPTDKVIEVGFLKEI